MAIVNKDYAIRILKSENLPYWSMRDTDNSTLSGYHDPVGNIEISADKLSEAFEMFQGSIVKLQLFATPAKGKTQQPVYTWRINLSTSPATINNTGHEHPGMWNMVLQHMQASNEMIRQANERAHQAQLEAIKHQYEHASHTHNAEGAEMMELAKMVMQALKPSAPAINDQPTESKVVSMHQAPGDAKQRLANAITKGLKAGLTVEHLEKLVDFVEKDPLTAQQLFKDVG